MTDQIKENRAFRGVWIPKEIWLSKNLTLQEKVFLVEISSLDNESGCFASNAYFSSFFGLSVTRVSIVINSLVKKEFLYSRMVYAKGSSKVTKRVLNICYRPPLINVIDPLKGKFKDSNTVSNTTNKKELVETKVSTAKSKFKFSHYDLEMAEWMFNQILTLNPNMKKPNLESWANTFRLIVESDKRDPVKVGEVFAWANQDSFWSSNILSPVSLRKQFDQLLIKMNQPNNPQKLSSTDGGDWRNKFKDSF